MTDLACAARGDGDNVTGGSCQRFGLVSVADEH